MKKKIIILLLVIFSNTIIYSQKKASIKSQYVTKILNEQNIYGLPKGTKIDILKKHDKETNTDIEIAIPISGNTKFDSKLHNILEAKKDNFSESVSAVEMPNAFGVTPISIYISKKIISFVFSISTENGDASHGGAIYYSYNYDVKKNKEIKFEDYFTIESDKDLDFVSGLINESLKMQDIENGRNGEFEEFEVSIHEDFNIQSDTITFNLGFIRSYAYGMFRTEIKKSKLEKLINNNYR